MRSLLAFVCGLVALLALLVTVPTVWISTHVADENGYVRFSSTLAKDVQLQGALAAYLSDEFAQRGVLPAALKPAATTVMTNAASRASNRPGFTEAWEETQRSFHRSAFSKPASDRIVVDVGPMASFVTQRVRDQLPVSLTVPDELLVPVVTDASDRRAVEQIDRTRWLGWVAAIVVMIGIAASIGFARRTSVAVIWLGIGAAAVAIVLRLLTGPLAQDVLDHTAAPSEFARTLQKLLVDRAADSIGSWLVVVAVVGAVVAVGGLAGRLVSRAGD